MALSRAKLEERGKLPIAPEPALDSGSCDALPRPMGTPPTLRLVGVRDDTAAAAYAAAEAAAACRAFAAAFAANM